MTRFFCILFLLFSVTVNASPQSQAQPIVGQFFGIWLNPDQTWKQKFRRDTPFQKLNRLYIAFGKIVTIGDHLSIAFDGDPNHVTQLIERMRHDNSTADIFLTVGGNDDDQSYGGAANDPAFAENVLQFLDQYGFNGFDIDWENDLDHDHLSQLVKNLHHVFQTQHKKLTLDVWPYPNAAYDMTVLKNNLDQINIMSYGVDASLEYCVNQYVAQGFPVNKIIGGIETEFGYYGGTDTLGPNGTIAQKSQFALKNGLAGMMAWRLDNDYTTSKNPNYPTYRGAEQLWQSISKLSQ